MFKKPMFIISGLLVSAVLNVLFNLIAAGIQKQAFNDQFNNQSIGWMIGCTIVGLCLSYWLSQTGESTSNSIVTKPGIVAKDLISREGSLEAHEKTGRGIDMERVDVKGNIILSSSDSQPSMFE